jgi:hypothetical protein
MTGKTKIEKKNPGRRSSRSKEWEFRIQCFIRFWRSNFNFKRKKFLILEFVNETDFIIIFFKINFRDSKFKSVYKSQSIEATVPKTSSE